MSRGNMFLPFYDSVIRLRSYTNGITGLSSVFLFLATSAAVFLRPSEGEEPDEADWASRNTITTHRRLRLKSSNSSHMSHGSCMKCIYPDPDTRHSERCPVSQKTRDVWTITPWQMTKADQNSTAQSGNTETIRWSTITSPWHPLLIS